MTKELQDLAWLVLPKEFKEEVKRKFQLTDADCIAYEILIDLFGIHNLTSDAEGEEMLICVKDHAVKLYDIANKAYAIKGDKYYEGYTNAMIDLFGPKYLPNSDLNTRSKENIAQNKYIMTRQEANLKIANILNSIPKVRDIQFWDSYNSVYLFPEIFEIFANKYPQQRAGQIICNYICPDYRNKEVSTITKIIMETLFPGNPDPFFEESEVTLKRLSK